MLQNFLYKLYHHVVKVCIANGFSRVAKFEVSPGSGQRASPSWPRGLLRPQIGGLPQAWSVIKVSMVVMIGISSVGTGVKLVPPHLAVLQLVLQWLWWLWSLVTWRWWKVLLGHDGRPRLVHLVCARKREVGDDHCDRGWKDDLLSLPCPLISSLWNYWCDGGWFWTGKSEIVQNRTRQYKRSIGWRTDDQYQPSWSWLCESWQAVEPSQSRPGHFDQFDDFNIVEIVWTLLDIGHFEDLRVSLMTSLMMK